MKRSRSQKQEPQPEPFRYRPTPPPPMPMPPAETGKRPERKPASARPASPSRRRMPVAPVSWPALMVWAFCLVMPVLAVCRASEAMDWRLLAGAALLISLVTWQLYRGDKQKAQNGDWRTPESTLHLAGLAGGWPAAFLAQRRYRHKIVKTRFQVYFWSIVFLHQFAALDYLLDWRFSRGAVHLLRLSERTGK